MATMKMNCVRQIYLVYKWTITLSPSVTRSVGPVMLPLYVQALIFLLDDMSSVVSSAIKVNSFGLNRK